MGVGGYKKSCEIRRGGGRVIGRERGSEWVRLRGEG